MEISSSFVGSRLKDYDTEVTWRNTMNYAASIGDNNSHYFDDEHEHGVIAPPAFSVALTWPISERIWDYIEAPDFPKEIIATQVHYTEHLSFHRPVKPGDRLKIGGRIAAILPHKAGTHIVIRFDAVDREGTPVFTEHIGAMMRGVRCTDEGRGEEDLPKVPGLSGDSAPIWETAIPIDSLAPFVYDGCTNIFFPIHTSVRFAHAVGLPGTILQGTATLAYALREITNREASGDPFELKSAYCRFTGMVLPGTTIRIQLTKKVNSSGGTDLFFVVLNADGQKAINNGYVRLGKNK